MSVTYPFAVPIDVLLAAHGHRPTHVTVAAIGPRSPLKCHRNAAAIAVAEPDRYTWWTGRAVSPGTDDWVQHSWVACGPQHLEITWSEAGTSYLGIPIPARLARAVRESWTDRGLRSDRESSGQTKTLALSRMHTLRKPPTKPRGPMMETSYETWWPMWRDGLTAAVAERVDAISPGATDPAIDAVVAYSKRATEMLAADARGVSIAPIYERPLAEQLLIEARRRDVIGEPAVLVWVAYAAMEALRNVMMSSIRDVLAGAAGQVGSVWFSTPPASLAAPNGQGVTARSGVHRHAGETCGRLPLEYPTDPRSRCTSVWRISPPER